MHRTLALLVTCAAFAHAELPPLPQPTTSFGAATTGDWLYAYGGNTGRTHEFHRECVTGNFIRLKVGASTTWETLPGGTALMSASLVAHEGSIIRIGGLNPENAKGEKTDLTSTTEVLRYDPDAGKWEPLPPLPEPRSSHDTVLIGDTLYLGGGWKLDSDDGEGTSAKWHDTALSLDLKNTAAGWRSHPQPFQRRALAAVAEKGRVWFIGGMDSDDKPSRAVDWWEPATGTWGKGPDLPEGAMAGFGVAACIAEGRILASPLTGKLSILSADQKTWEPAGALSKPRFFHRLLPMPDGRLLAVGGSSRKEQIPALEYVKIGQEPTHAAPTEKPPSTSAAPRQPSEPGTESFPQWRGPNRDGISTATAFRKDWPAGGLPVLWRASIGTGMSSPVIANGRIILHGNDAKGTDYITALDAANGTRLWQHAIPCKTEAHELPIVPVGPGATPTIDGTSVFVLTREGQLACLDLASGAPAWTKNLLTDLGGKRPVYGYTQSPLVVVGRIILDLGCEPGKATSTAALDAATGELKWTAGTGEAGYSSARTFDHAGRKCVAMFKGESLQVFDLADGHILATHRTTARDFSNAVTPTFIGDHILISNTGTEPAALLSLDADPELKPVWTHKQFALLFNSPIVHDGSVFAFNEKRRGHHEFTCLDTATGETRWVSNAISTATFILADGHWIFLTREGDLALALATSKELKLTSKFKATESKCYATPALADGRIFIRDNTGELTAFSARLQ